MDDNEQPYRRYLFVVRLWCEASSTDRTKWHGQVQYANDGDRLAFRDWQEFASFCEAKLALVENDDEV